MNVNGTAQGIAYIDYSGTSEASSEISATAASSNLAAVVISPTPEVVVIENQLEDRGEDSESRESQLLFGQPQQLLSLLRGLGDTEPRYIGSFLPYLDEDDG